MTAFVNILKGFALVNFCQLYSGTDLFKRIPRDIATWYFVLTLFVVFVLFILSLLVVLTLFVLANLSPVANSRPHFGINIPRFVSSVLLSRKANQASVLEGIRSTFVCQT